MHFIQNIFPETGPLQKASTIFVTLNLFQGLRLKHLDHEINIPSLTGLKSLLLPGYKYPVPNGTIIFPVHISESPFRGAIYIVKPYTDKKSRRDVIFFNSKKSFLNEILKQY